jgi:biopolymer transport protein ExbB/TolQ
VATAAGLLVAIYAIIAYNYFVSRVNAIGVQYKVFCEEFMFALGDYARGRAGTSSGEPPAAA